MFASVDDLDEDDRKHLDEVFDARIFPVLTPWPSTRVIPFPYISDLSLNLAVEVLRPEVGRAALRSRQGAESVCRGSSPCPTANGSCRSSR